MSILHDKRPCAKPRPSALDKQARKAGRETAYKQASKAARSRDGHRCRICGSAVAVETHHLRPRSLVGKARRDELRNLVTLCGGPGSCHEQVTRHVVKLYAHDEAEGANGFLRVERWHQPKGQPGEYRLIRERA